MKDSAPPDQPVAARPARLRFVWGVKVGVSLALVLTAWVLVMLPFGGSLALRRLGITSLQAAAVYLVGGIAGGAIVGLLLQIGRWVWGAMIVGATAVLPVAVVAVGVLRGFQPWTTVHTLTVLVYAVLVGAPVALAYREMFWKDMFVTSRDGRSRAGRRRH